MNTPNLENISKKSKIKVADILNILKIIKTENPTVSELIKITNLSHGQIKRLLLSLTSAVNYNVASPNLTLTKSGVDLLIKQPLENPQNYNLHNLENFITDSKNLMPPSKREYDQFYGTVGTVMNRVKKLAEQGDLQDRKIIFLGDDDLTSLAVAYTLKAQEIAVLEIDENTLNVIEKVSKEHHLKINYTQWDLTKAIPKEFLHKFDTIFTDPPYTENGFDTFLRRSLESTKDNALSSHYICYGTSSLSREKSLKVQQIINTYGLFIREKISNFNKYVSGAETIGNTSDLYILEKTPQTKLGKGKSIKRLYTWE